MVRPFSEAGAIVNMTDFAIRPALAMKSNETLQTGKRKYRFIRTPHLPHGWDAGVMFESLHAKPLCISFTNVFVLYRIGIY